MKHIQNIEKMKKLDPSLVYKTGYLICTVSKREEMPFSNIAVSWGEIPDLHKELAD